MTLARIVESALSTLCRRARVHPDDKSREAGLAVCAVMVRDRIKGELGCPLKGALTVWLAAATGLANLAVGDDRVLILHRGGRPSRTVTETVLLPRAVMKAVYLSDHLMVLELIEGH